MLKKILIGLIGLLAILTVVIVLQPTDYHVERSQKMNAPADIVWAQFADFDQWQHWSHWAKSDPTQKTTITGEVGEPGHKTVWVGEKTGRGSMAILSAAKPTDLAIKLVFEEPMKSEAKTDFKVKPDGEGVTVTWSMDGKNDFAGKAFSLFMNMDEMIGGAYENGLADMKTIAEKKAKEAKEAKAAEAAAALAAAEAAKAAEGEAPSAE